MGVSSEAEEGNCTCTLVKEVCQMSKNMFCSVFLYGWESPEKDYVTFCNKYISFVRHLLKAN